MHRPPLGIPPGLRTNIISAPPSGEYGVQSLNFSRFDSMRKIKFLATFYLNILLPGYSIDDSTDESDRQPRSRQLLLVGHGPETVLQVVVLFFLNWWLLPLSEFVAT